jgi:MFS family permease
VSGTALFTRAFGLLTIAHFFSALGYASMILLPLYLDHLGASRTEIGAIMASAAIGGLGSRPFVGWALDTIGRRPTLIVGTLLSIVGLAGIGLVEDTGMLVYGIRIVFGMGAGTVFTGYFTFASDIVPLDRRTEGIAIFGVAGLVPLIVNPISSLIGIEGADVRWFLPMVGAAIVISIPFLLAVPEPRIAEERPPLTLRAVLTSLGARPLVSVWFASVIFSGCVNIYMSFATVIAAKNDVLMPTALWFTYAGGAVFVRIFGARIPDRIGPARVVAPALTAYAAAFLIASHSTNDLGFLGSGLMAGIGHGYCFPVLTSLVVSRVSDEHRGSGVAMFTALWGLSSLVFSPLFGSLADHTDDQMMFWVAAAMAGIAMIQWRVLERRYGESE